MNRCTRIVSLAGIAAASSLIAWSVAASQGAPAASASPEIELLKKYVGTWNAEVEMSAAAGQPATKEAGQDIVRAVAGGTWISSDFETKLMGAPFQGHEILGWDGVQKKYVFSWVDSMGAGITSGEGTFDAATKTFKFTVHGYGMDGKPQTWHQVDMWKDDNTREWQMFEPGPDGKEVLGITIHYKRAK